MWIFPWIKVSWHSCFIDTNLDDLIHSVSLSVRGFLPLTRTESITHMHGLILHERRTSFCTGSISRKFSWFLFMFSTGFTSFFVLLLFLPSIILSLETLMSCSGGADRPGELCYKMTLISNELIRMVNFSTRITDRTLTVLIF